MNKFIKYCSIGFGLLLLFTVFSREVKRGFLKSTDFDATVKLQNKISARYDQVMDDGAILIDPIVSSIIVLGLTGWTFLNSKGKRKIIAVSIPLAFILLTLIEVYGKNFVPHPGPPFFMIKQPTTIFPQFHVVQPYSYPSGHAARATFLGVIGSGIMYQVTKKVSDRKRFWMLGAITGYVIFIYVSRIYLGHHWLSDIIGGALLGAGFGLFPLALL
ncbi:phosphatase PAP2 family protein [Candidatus Gottesmanbacteria bacterium]|nr:phosphatase PAP2 family protein [Candidatus Gottesmanbacteria bacterium]